MRGNGSNEPAEEDSIQLSGNELLPGAFDVGALRSVVIVFRLLSDIEERALILCVLSNFNGYTKDEGIVCKHCLIINDILSLR